MPTFQITGPDGRKFRVSGENAEGALAAVQQMAPQQPSQFDTAFDAGSDRAALAPQIAPAAQRADPRNSFMGKVDTVMRGAADMASFGFADEIAAGADAFAQPLLGTGAPGASFGERYEQNVAQQRATDASDEQNRFGYRLGGQVAGALPAAAIPAGAITGGAGLATKVGVGMLSGAAQGAAYGAGSANDGDRLQGAQQGAIAGGIIGGAVPVVGNAVGKVIGGRAGRAAVPSVDQLKASSQALYDAAEQQGVRIAPQSFQNAVNRISHEMRGKGVDPQITPGSWRALERLEQAVSGQLDIREVDTLRKVLRAAASSPNSADSGMAKQMIARIDNYMSNLTPADVTAGNAQTAVKMITGARSLWSRKAKGDIIEEAMTRAGNAATGLENGLRNEFRSLLKSSKHNWTPEERAALRRVVNGGLGANALRFLGTFGYSPDQARSFLGTVIGGSVGAAAGGPVGMVALPAVGTGARIAARELAKSRAAQASAVVRNGGQAPFSPQAARAAEAPVTGTLDALGRGAGVPWFLDMASGGRRQPLEITVTKGTARN